MEESLGRPGGVLLVRAILGSHRFSLQGVPMKLINLGDDPMANQMSLISDTDECIKFLEFAGNKSILNEHTINCRLTACNNLFSILNEGEDNVDYLLENLDLLVNRFRNKNSNVQQSTLKVYKSRVKSSLEDYRAWCKDPIAWEKSVLEKSNVAHAKERKAKAAAKEKPVKAEAPIATARVEKTAAEPRPTIEKTPRGGRKVIFPVRSDFNVELVIPDDGLSMKEMLKLGLFLYPYCKDSEGGENEERNSWTMQ